MFSKEDLKVLTDSHEGWCVSIFLPTHRAGPDVAQDSIRFKNLLREAESRLVEAGLRSPEVGTLLQPLVRLLDDSRFWQHQLDGLAIFRAPDLMRRYRVPLTVPEVVVVAERFHVKPLLPLLSGDERFYVLALSQREIRLFAATRYGIRRVELDGVTQSLDETLRDDDRERGLQFHTGAPAAQGRRAAVFHGQGQGVDDAKDKVLRYFRRVDTGLHGRLGEDRVPLVLAGVDYLLPLYREANTYRHVSEGGITGNPETLDANALHAQTWPIVEPIFRKAREQAAARYRELAGTGRTSEDLTEIVSAATHGRVDTLFVAVGIQRWGAVDPALGAVTAHDELMPGDEDLLNVAAIQTLLRGGTAYVVEPTAVPGAERGAVAAALLRF